MGSVMRTTSSSAIGSILLCITATSACGTDHAAIDAAADARSDSTVALDAFVAARPDVVTVILRRPSVAEPGTTVTFHDATGAIVDQQELDPSGVAASANAAVEAVTVQVRYTPFLLTIQGVHLGNVLRFEPGFVTRDFVLPQLPAGSGTPLVSTGCEGDGVRTDVSPVGLCVGGGPTNIEVLTFDALTNCYYSSVFDGPDVPVVTLPAWRLCHDREHITYAPTSTRPLGPRMYTAYGFVRVGSEDLGWIDLDRDLPSDALVVLSQRVGSDVGASWAFVDHVLTAGERAHGITFASPDVPLVERATADVSDPMRPIVSWSTTGSYGIARLEIDLGYGADVGWHIIAPASRGSITVPDAPPDSPISTRPVAWQLELSDTAEARDYPAFVAHPLGPVAPAARVGVRAYASDRF